MITRTNHGATVELPARRGGKGEAIVKALIAFRNRHPGHVYVAWACDVENAVIDEERAKLRTDMIDLETPVKARGTTFVADRRIPRGMVYIMSHDPRYGLENPHVADQTVLDYLGNLAQMVVYP